MDKHFFFLMALLLSLSFAQAFSVTSFYHKSNPLSGLNPGESREIALILSNPSEKQAKIEVSILKGDEVVNFPDGRVYDLVPYDKKNVRVKIDVPEDARQGDSYEVSILSDALPVDGEKGEGSVQFSPNYVTSFSVFVGEPKERAEESGSENIEKESDSRTEKSSESKAEKAFMAFYAVLVTLIIGILVLIVAIARRRKGIPENETENFKYMP